MEDSHSTENIEQSSLSTDGLQMMTSPQKRMSSEDRKDADKIKAELLKEFERGKRNREEALDQLGKRSRQEGESAQNYAYKLKELVKLAYPSFENKIQETIAKDYFVKAVHNDMQVALKSLKEFEGSNIIKIADETTRLELAGIQAIQCVRSRVNTVDQICDESTIINSIAKKMMENCNRPDSALQPGVWTKKK